MTSPHCAIFLDDEPLATDAQSLSNRDITVLDGLSVKCGMSTRLDQPDPTTLTASIALPGDAGACAALEKIAPGRRISVIATSFEAPADADIRLPRPDRAGDRARAGQARPCLLTRTLRASSPLNAVSLPKTPAPPPGTRSIPS